MLRAGHHLLILIALLPLTAADAQAQRLLETDGIELRGTARIVAFGAGTCNVREDRETAAEYQRKKANHGKPVDVWQLEFSVYNGSGHYLDHLIARYRIAAEWPPCTNWSGEYGSYPKQVQWSSTSGFIQKSGRNVVAPRETRTDTVFLVVFHEHEPRFDNWSLDYEFGEAAGARPEAKQPQPGTRAANAPSWMNEIHGSQGGTLPPSIRDGEACSGKPAGTACWMELASPPHCYAWFTNLRSPEIVVTWNGRCDGGLAQGAGLLKAFEDGSEVQEWEGSLVDGKAHGDWIIRHPNGAEFRGPYVRGNMHGDWVHRYPNGAESGGRYVDGKVHGDWVIRFPSGQEERGPVADGERHGDWVIRYPDGREDRGPYLADKKHGQWVEHYHDGSWSRGPYVNGERNGEWTEYTSQDVGELRYSGPYVDGKRHGRWVASKNHHHSCTVQFVEGQQQGEWRCP